LVWAIRTSVEPLRLAEGMAIVYDVVTAVIATTPMKGVDYLTPLVVRDPPVILLIEDDLLEKNGCAGEQR
jgi:hypothetical protein